MKHNQWRKNGSFFFSKQFIHSSTEIQDVLDFWKKLGSFETSEIPSRQRNISRRLEASATKLWDTKMARASPVSLIYIEYLNRGQSWEQSFKN